MREHILEISRDSSWYFISNVVFAALAFISIPILTRLLTPSDYGVYTLVATAILTLSPLVYYGLSTALMRYYAEYDRNDDLTTLYSTGYRYVPHFMLFFIGVVLPLTAFVLPLGRYRQIACLGVVVFALTSVSMVSLELMRGRQLAWQYSAVNITIGFGRYLLAAALIKWAGFGIAGLFWGWLAVLLLVVPLELFSLRFFKYFRWNAYSPSLNRKLMHYGGFLILTNIFGNILTAADRYIVQLFKGSSEVGLYAVVYNLLTNSAGVAIGFLVLGTTPVVLKVYEREGEEKTRRLISRVTRYAVVILIPSLIVLWVLRYRIMSVFTSPEYMPAVKVFLPLLIANLLLYVCWLPLLAFLIKKKTALLAKVQGAVAAFNVGMNFLLVPFFGYVAAAWVTAASYLLLLAAYIFFAHRLIPWEFPSLDALKSSVAAVVMGLAVWGISKAMPRGFFALAALLAIGVVIYLLGLAVAGWFSPAEKDFFRDAVGRLRRKRS